MTRLVVRSYTFACNEPRCEVAIADLTGCGEENSARAAWSEAAAQAWTAGPGPDEHFCPEHSADTSGQRPPVRRAAAGCSLIPQVARSGGRA